MPSSETDPEVGLCSTCRHAAVQESARGSRFWRCLRAEGDERFRRYPPLPVATCTGFERAGEDRARRRGRGAPRPHGESGRSDP